MNSGELFTRTVTVLPVAVRERLDGDNPIDWPRLEDAETGVELDEAARVHRRLPSPVEALARRLMQDLGIVPADLAAASERRGAASAWIPWVALEAEAGSYQLRNERSGRVHTGIRPETLLGYVTLGLELEAAIHEASERWMEAGERFEAAAEGAHGPLAQCAARMRAYLACGVRRDAGAAQCGARGSSPRAGMEQPERGGPRRARRGAAQHRTWCTGPAKEPLRAGDQSPPQRL